MTYRWLQEKEYRGIGGGGQICMDAEFDESQSPIGVFSVNELPQLVQAIGYIKSQQEGATYLRGQGELHGGRMLPSLYRSQKKLHSSNLTRILSEFIASIYEWRCTHDHHTAANCPEQVPRIRDHSRNGSSLLTSGMRRYAVEPLFQHYGIKTGWIDVVDNIWVALWFACHDFVTTDRYTHIVKKTPRSGDDHVYLITTTIDGVKRVDLNISKANNALTPGLDKYTSGARVIDLRTAVPSVYLRPHAQHGLLIRHSESQQSISLGAFRIPLAKALDWLGSSLLLSPFGLFPPPTVDEGYRKMIEGSASIQFPPNIGAIEIVGPGY